MKLLRNIRVIILIIVLALCLVAINPRPWQSCAAIRHVDADSAAALGGMSAPKSDVTPVQRERVVAINGQPIASADDYYRVEKSLVANVSVRVDTNKQSYVLRTQPHYNITILDERERVTIIEEIFDNESGNFTNRTRTAWQNKTLRTVVGTEPLGLAVYNAPKSNIRYGLDISGGARVILQPERVVTQDEMDQILDTLTERLNVYGLADLVVREANDLSGAQYIIVEIAGASEQDVRDLALRQGKFEAKIANATVFNGGDDITYVCRSPECSGISPRGCAQGDDGTWSCEFQFSITMRPEAAQRQADMTRNLETVLAPDGQRYLSKKLELYLDDVKTDELNIGESLRGSAVTQISISGGSTGATERAAAENALAEMKQLQTILLTGSLPVKLTVVKTDAISAELGEEFIRNAALVGALAFLAVTIIMIARYRNPRISIPVIITLISEVLIILGVAAVFKQNLDLAAIAGILVAIGTGVDDQIVIADETIGNRKAKQDSNWKSKMNKAFFIIFAAYFTAMASLVPLLFAGAGLVRGFAIASMVGITAGVLITRPVFAVIMEKLEKKE